MKVGVNIKKLTKIYRSSKKTVKAIEDIDITLYTGQVTTLLGQNGAGKTTLMYVFKNIYYLFLVFILMEQPETTS